MSTITQGEQTRNPLGLIDDLSAFEFVPDIPCEVGDHRGPSKPADWLVLPTCIHGKGAVAFCQACLDHKLSRPHLVCATCSTVFSPPSLAYKRIEPIR